MLSKDKIVITGGAGLVGQNLVRLLVADGFENITVVDKDADSLAAMKRDCPGVTAVHADLAEPGSWRAEFEGGRGVVQLQAQVTAKEGERFERNTVRSTANVLSGCKEHGIDYIVHVSSSVVNSVADDDYTRSKKTQERMVTDSGIEHCILRPTLMFGPFDPKHLGWLSRFMERVPVFPIPGHGRYVRQPLYAIDFCRIIEYCLVHKPSGKTYDIVGEEQIYYIDMIRSIKKHKRLKTVILNIPYGLFFGLLKLYSLISDNPPFTADQLKALTAGDMFHGVNIRNEFEFSPTEFENAMYMTFQKDHHGCY